MSFSISKNIWITGIDSPFSNQLLNLLRNAGFHAEASPKGSRDADLVFCGADALPKILSTVRSEKRGIPVIAVGSSDSISTWLDALEAGASDYLCTPFEPLQVTWALESNLGAALQAA